jgi:hypothetical protein
VGGTSEEQERRAIETAFAEFERVFADSEKAPQVAALRALLPDIGNPATQTAFVEGLRRLIGAPDGTSDLDGSSFFFKVSDPRAVFVNAEQASSSVGEGQGEDNRAVAGVQGAGLSSLLGGVANAVSSLQNNTTYYEMKQRAGTVGQRGLAPLIDELGQRAALQRIHLVGHSFGARLVTAAAMHSTSPKLHSLCLLQAAFSHNAFSSIGYFRKLVDSRRVAGPIIITHTENDKAVGKAYAIASRISNDTSSGVGDASDKYGGLGRNGAVNMGASEVSHTMRALLEPGTPYDLKGHLIHNLESSAFIHDHGDVEGKAVAWAISQAIATPA